ncbi:NAD-dependent epimerase/dehydratase family protein [Aurantimonas sp. 22II-16-19i]|uniref:NAD-dependent epimerase/dehydratase family protein n=1 Tax=Aurantimonas sp. 22II-16-19i TaxID=1317114 RepID=UPI0009F7AD8F|nr:NAD-dependent epimerase/dehydratase family protein [Aurantimonas sp. 22II-16-19i]ORE88041.1 dihydrokaempferol 4-reductase [Aurantimonas sp. 22II-16-19i]
MTDQRVLLTGATGFIARHIALQLLLQGYRVRGTVRSAEKGEALRATLAKAGADVARLEVAVADLTRDAGWDEAARGCDFVCHTASPFPARQPADKLALVPIAREGTLRVVCAAAKAGAKRLVVTSSVASITYGHDPERDPVFTGDEWSNVDSPDISAYAVSKTLAERAAWEEAGRAELPMVAINPALVAGPLIGEAAGTSVQLIGMMMRGKLPAVPDIVFGVVDVRDVAAAHVAALTADGAVGRRFIVSAGSLSMMEIGRAIAEAFPEYRNKVPRFALPDVVVRMAALLVGEARAAIPELGRRKELSTEPARAVLGFAPADPREAVAATVRSLRERSRAV